MTLKKVREGKYSKIIASYLSLQLLIQMIQPTAVWALTGGPAQPEFNSFTPIGTSDMVDLSSGDFSYNLPLMDVGGYPLNLAYGSGIGMDQEASWVGLGWNLNVGQINRQVRGIPDDFNGNEGDVMTYENNVKDNVTVGANLKIHPAVAGVDFGLDIGIGLGVQYNNYRGFTFKPSIGISYEISNSVTVGMNLTTSTTEGANVKPSVKLSKIGGDKNKLLNNLNGNYALSMNSREGITNIAITNNLTRQIANNRFTRFMERNNAAAFGGSFNLSFANQSFTPQKRHPYKNTSIAFNAALGGEFWMLEGQGEIYAYASRQKMIDRFSTEKAFGYENTDLASKHDVLDFNREKDRSVSEYTTTLPIPNYTYDIYNISGQGIAGTIRPFRSQVGYVYDKYVKDKSDDISLGLELGVGNLVHFGGDIKYSPTNSSTGLWTTRNYARNNFIEQNTGNTLAYEKVYFKNIAEMNVDHEAEIFYNQLGGYEPIRLGVGGFALNKKSIAGSYLAGTGNVLTPTTPFTKVKRTDRLVRNQSVQKLTKTDINRLTANYINANKPDVFSGAKPHHTSGMKITKTDGTRYLYLQPAYNKKKVEASFNVSGNSNDNDCITGLVDYGGNDDSVDNNNGSDHFFNRVETPAYAHTFLLSSILSSDYRDINNNGPDDEDFGTYTHFTYDKPRGDYKWRIPFQLNKATLNEGLNSLEKDQTGSYVYGEKELVYIKKIETKTHVAIFEISDRQDAGGVQGMNGGAGSDPGKLVGMQKLDKIKLFSKPEFLKDGLNAEPIKVAHFIYDYELCPNVPNNLNNPPVTPHEEANQGGKLTLKKLFFTYRNSNMGKYTPYEFKYGKDFDGDGQVDNNYAYDIKSYDAWGNYKENNGSCDINGETTNAEFPYVDQDKEEQDQFASAWSIAEVKLPSGGKIEINYEADEYQYVQNKKALQMFKVVGAGIDSNPNAMGNVLYNNSSSSERKYLFLETDEPVPGNSQAEQASFVRQNYIGELENEVIYFRFLLNMIRNTNFKYDYVTGYMRLDYQHPEAYVVYPSPNGGSYIALKMQTVEMKGGLDGNRQVNPISKAGWNFARKHLTRVAYSQNGAEDNFTIANILDDMISQIANITEIFKGPNKFLRDKDCAQLFRPNKSWIRLQNPNGKKLGGGIRVKQLALHDEWDVMTGNDDDEVYQMKYGQEYSYDNLDGTTSGVATYEPYVSKENPFVVPFEDHDINKILAPSDGNYVEGPLGSSFFPSPKVTYGRVIVKNLQRSREVDDGNGGIQTLVVRKHADGFEVNEFYTTRDFPTIEKHTPIDAHYNEIGTGVLASLFALNVYQDRHLALSQGFMVNTNDMNGKQKSQRAYPEGAIGSVDAISGVDYIYHTKEDGTLLSDLPVMDENGQVEIKTLGVTYDVVNDFRTSKSFAESYGADVNVALSLYFAPPPIFIIPVWVTTIIPSLAFHRNTMRSAATTKVVYTSGVLKETISYDYGASVSKTNKLWDANTGEVLLTETTNEFKENNYMFNYPGYWNYVGLGAASENLDLEAAFSYASGYYSLNAGGTSASTYLVNGDEVWLDNYSEKLWVVNVGDNGANSFDLMNRDGVLLNSSQVSSDKLRIIGSGRRNQQIAVMGTITSMINPFASNAGFDIDTFVSNSWNDYRIIEAKAEVYSDEWEPQCECNIPNVHFDENGKVVVVNGGTFNPYLYNMKGNWRVKRSSSYLAGRYNGIDDPNPRNNGFFNHFSPYYKYDGSSWIVDETNWTYTSEVTQYSPYGEDIENKDGLGRYSSVQLGFNYRFPTAVASNSRYQEIGYDGFEDSDTQCEDGHFNFQKSVGNGGIQISEERSHSGRKSIKLNPNSAAVIESRVVECEENDGSNNSID